MSHQPERQEKICLNCHIEIYGRYCHRCGQENIVTKQSFWSLAKHFVYDIFHFDGKFFDTLKYLLFRPGYVPREYLKGRRSSYLDPIRMYLFTSAVFFLIFFSMKEPSFEWDRKGFSDELTMGERYHYAGKLTDSLRIADDDNVRQTLIYLLDSHYRITVKPDKGLPVTNSTFRLFDGEKAYYATATKIKNEVTGNKTEGWLTRNMEASWEKLKKKHNYDEGAMLRDIANSFMHRFPYLLFLSLPFFALILKGLYGSNKTIYYSEHAVFTLYHYIFMFILLLIYFFFEKSGEWTGMNFFSILGSWLLVLSFVYLYIAMYRFYRQGRGKTALKFLLLNLQAAILLIVLILIFLVFSFLKS